MTQYGNSALTLFYSIGTEVLNELAWLHDHYAYLLRRFILDLAFHFSHVQEFQRHSAFREHYDGVDLHLVHIDAELSRPLFILCSRWRCVVRRGRIRVPRQLQWNSHAWIRHCCQMCTYTAATHKVAQQARNLYADQRKYATSDVLNCFVAKRSTQTIVNCSCAATMFARARAMYSLSIPLLVVSANHQAS